MLLVARIALHLCRVGILFSNSHCSWLAHAVELVATSAAAVVVDAPSNAAAAHSAWAVFFMHFESQVPQRLLPVANLLPTFNYSNNTAREYLDVVVMLDEVFPLHPEDAVVIAS